MVTTMRYLVRVQYGPPSSRVEYRLPSQRAALAYAQTFPGPWDVIEVIRHATGAVLWTWSKTPTHSTDTANARPACEGYTRPFIPDTEPGTTDRAAVTCMECIELLEDEPGPLCPECARSFGPHYRGPCRH